MAALGSANWTMVMDGRGEAVRLPFTAVSASFFEVLGARPMLGRTFRAEDDVANAGGVIVLSYGTWIRRFGGDPSIVGNTATLDQKLYTIIGVMPRGFDFPRGAEFWTPVVPVLIGSSAQLGEDVLTNVGVLFVVGRLRDGVTPQVATEELDRVASSLRIGTPKFGSSVTVTPFLEYLFGPVQSVLWLLFAAVGVLLLIACANISALMLTQASMRRREYAIRMALGATRLNLGKLWILETFTLSVVGGVLGLISCWGITAAIVTLGPDDIPRIAEVSVNLPVAAFTAGVVSFTALICGIPAIRQTNAANMLEALNDAARSTPGRHSRRTRSALLVLQMALAVVLLVGAGLVVRSFASLRALDLGFSPRGVLVMLVIPRSPKPPADRWFGELISRVEARPGVKAAGAVFPPPLVIGMVGQGTWFMSEGQSDAPEVIASNPRLNYEVATPGYFRAMGIALRRGRLFDGTDDDRAPRVVIVGDTTARRLWPGQDPIGRRLWMPSFAPGPRQALWRTVVGVVDDVRYQGIDDGSLDIYDPAQQAGMAAEYLVVRTEDAPLAMAADVRAIAKSLDPRVVIDRVTTFEAVVARTFAPWRLSAWMFTLFAAFASLLAAVGLFSLVTLDVASRQREFAIRMAVGALPGDILRLAAGCALWQVALGVVSGLFVALAATRAMQSLLFGVEAVDGVTYASVVAFVLSMVSIAVYWPARRAATVQVSALLRRE
jgi:predicted permease